MHIGCVRFARYCGKMYSRHLFFRKVDYSLFHEKIRTNLQVTWNEFQLILNDHTEKLFICFISCPLTFTCIHWPTFFLTTNSFIHYFMFSFICPSSIHSFIHSFIHSHIHVFISFIYSYFDKGCPNKAYKRTRQCRKVVREILNKFQ